MCPIRSFTEVLRTLFISHFKLGVVLVTPVQIMWLSATKIGLTVPELASGFAISTRYMHIANLCFPVPETGHQAPYVTESQMMLANHIITIKYLPCDLKSTLHPYLQLFKT